MAGTAATVKLTANFEANLVSIEAFWTEQGASRAYDQLLAVLVDSLIPTLEQHPRVGRPFLTLPAHSVEAQAAINRLNTRIGRGELREYLLGDYLVLYAVIAKVVHLLAIRHHRQLSFELETFWPR